MKDLIAAVMGSTRESTALTAALCPACMAPIIISAVAMEDGKEEATQIVSSARSHSMVLQIPNLTLEMV